jgi:hypothetical protein
LYILIVKSHNLKEFKQIYSHVFVFAVEHDLPKRRIIKHVQLFCSYVLSNELDTLFLSDVNYVDYDELSSSTTTTTAAAPVTVLKQITCNGNGFWNGFPDSELFFGECQGKC